MKIYYHNNILKIRKVNMYISKIYKNSSNNDNKNIIL